MCTTRLNGYLEIKKFATCALWKLGRFSDLKDVREHICADFINNYLFVDQMNVLPTSRGKKNKNSIISLIEFRLHMWSDPLPYFWQWLGSMQWSRGYYHKLRMELNPLDRHWHPGTFTSYASLGHWEGRHISKALRGEISTVWLLYHVTCSLYEIGRLRR